jgi:DNA-binding NarL/FixJ family response regulator
MHGMFAVACGADTTGYGNPERKTMNLLIVDDHAEARAVIRSYLGPLAGTVTECADGRSAIALIRRNAPDVMTLDLRLGPEDGIAILEFIRAHFPNVHVLVVTQFREPAIAELVIRLGAAGCFGKSDLGELRAYLQGYLAQAGVL